MFSLSSNAKVLYEGAKNKKDGKTRRWILKNGYSLPIADADFPDIHVKIAAVADAIYAEYAVKYDSVMAAVTVEELRTI